MYNVLLVDNEPAILSALSHAIDWAAHDCHILNIARDGREAMLQFAQEAPDIVISDIRMPEVDGLELARWISENHPACKVIILTGFPDFSYAQQAINYRVVDFVLKPTSEDSLLAALDKATQRLAENQAGTTDKKAAARKLRSLERSEERREAAEQLREAATIEQRYLERQMRKFKEREKQQSLTR